MRSSRPYLKGAPSRGGKYLRMWDEFNFWY
jgi:hypothetical protein